MNKLLFACCVVLLCACARTLPVRDGQTAFALKQYATAVQYLPNEFERAKSRIEKGKIANKLAESLFILGRYDQAATWYRKAFDNGADAESLRKQALCLKAQHKYAQAIEVLKEFGTEIGSSYEVRREIMACQVAQGWLEAADSTGFKLTPVGFNTTSAEYSPVLDKFNRLVFTSDRLQGSKKNIYAWTGRGYHDLWVVDSESGAAKPLEGVNTADHEGGAVFWENELYFCRCPVEKNTDTYCRLYLSRYDQGRWQPATPLHLFDDLQVNYGQAALSPNGQTLVFSAAHRDGWGEHDLWICHRTRAGDWSTPHVLPRSINTVGREMFPVFHNDTLYFASDGHVGMGGLDIFKTWLLPNGWQPPINMRAPVNSGADDFGFLVAEHNPTGLPVQKGYLTSNRNGSDDIFAFERMPELKPAPSAKPLARTPGVIMLSVEVLEKIFAEADNPNSKLLGKRPLSGADIAGWITPLVSAEVPLMLEVKAGQNLRLTAQRAGYLTAETSVSTAGIAVPDGDTVLINVELVLNKIFRNREIVLENIYYDYDKADIRPDARPTLDALATLLLQNPTIRIILGSHTDCRGNEGYNKDLSQRRAESAVAYLIERGVTPDRLQAVGYGESRPAEDCVCARCTEQQHQRNRRTTFTIID